MESSSGTASAVELVELVDVEPLPEPLPEPSEPASRRRAAARAAVRRLLARAAALAAAAAAAHAAALARRRRRALARRVRLHEVDVREAEDAVVAVADEEDDLRRDRRHRHVVGEHAA